MPVLPLEKAIRASTAGGAAATLVVGSQVGPVGEPATADQMTDHSGNQVADDQSGSGGAHDTGGAGAGGSRVLQARLDPVPQTEQRGPVGRQGRLAIPVE